MELASRPVADGIAVQAMLRHHGLAAWQIAAPFPLWLLAVPDRVNAALLACLSPDEHARAQRFVPDLSRRRYLATHGALRMLGEAYFGIAAARQRYEDNSFGKPVLAGYRDAWSSISYSGTWSLVGWSGAEEIGVDIEVIRPIADADALIMLHCTPAEQKGLLMSGRPVCSHAFLGTWVRKEACMKAVGKGFGIAPSSFECGVALGSSIVEIDGREVECENCDLKGNLAVAWARLRREA